MTHMSNALGTIPPVERIIRMAHGRGVPVARRRLAGRATTGRSTSQALGCDFYAFTGHKLYGPTGIGALYGTGASSRRCRRTRAAAT